MSEQIKSKAVMKQLDRLEEQRELIESYNALALQAEQIAEGRERVDVRIGWDNGSIKGVLFFIEDALHMNEAVPILREFGKLGWKQAKEPEDYAAIKRRTWTMEHKEDKTPLKICLLLKWGEGAKCDYVQVGFKEEPVYELQCDE